MAKRFNAGRANRNQPCYGKNLSTKAYDSGTKQDRTPGHVSTNNYDRSLGDKMNAPAGRGKAFYDKRMPRSKDADARGEASFSGREYGGDGTPTVLGSGRMSLGLGSAGGDVRHSAAKAKENVSPKNAHDFSDFGNVGGSPPKHTLG